MKALIVAGAVTLMALAPFTAFAHQHEAFKIGDRDFLFEIGSLNEPVFVDDKTGVELNIKLADSNNPLDFESTAAKPVEKLNETLKVEISAGDKKQTFDLSPIYGEAGSYKAPFYPTVATTYAYRVFGNINSTPVDLTFTCNPAGHPASPEDKTITKLSDAVSRTYKSGAFGCPKPRDTASFPEKTATLASLTADPKESTTSSNSQLPLILGIIGSITGIAALFKSKRS